MSNRYKEVGVDIEAGNAFVNQLKEKAPSIGGFGGMFKVPAGYENPILVSGADGVGTKINIARVAGDYSTIGIDLVAMCVNDVITSGAKPLYFLDYVSTKKLDTNVASIVDGIVKGCWMSGCELLGGETAEHHRQSDYDLAGFCTGIVEEHDVVDGSIIKPGDAIIGIQSSGIHSNGYTLVNDMLWRHQLYYKDTPELLEPTRIYAATVQRLLDEVPVLGMAHITGGGLEENVSRCLPAGLQAHINWNSWPMPEIFNKIMLAGEVPEEDMKRIFNMGIGYCIVVPPEVVDDTMILIDYPSQVIGHVRCTM
tara:strand:- start:846 stop:1775 length:930 start_codon:yes stop_codon:yes gene_type:complete